MNPQLNLNIMANMFFKLIILLLISCHSIACPPDSTVQIIIDNLSKYNQITITSSEINPPYTYNLSPCMYEFNNNDTSIVYTVSDTIQGFFVWESGKQSTCRYINKKFVAKKVIIGGKYFKNTYGIE